MRIFVTGASGQLARSLAERAKDNPLLELVAVGRPELELEEPGSAAAAIRQAAPDLVINAAAYTDVDGAEEHQFRALRINGEAPGEIAAASAAIGCPLIHLSTDYVFDGSYARPYDEEAPTRPLNSYGRSKLAGEEAVRAGNPDHLIVRTAWVYSPFGRNFVKTMFDAANERDELKVVTDQRGSPTSALALADALLRVIDLWRQDKAIGQGQTYHLAGSGEASWYDLARQVMDERQKLGLRTARLIPIRASDWPMRAVRPPYSALGCAKFARDFGFALPDWRTSVREVVERLARSDC